MKKLKEGMANPPALGEDRIDGLHIFARLLAQYHRKMLEGAMTEAFEDPEPHQEMENHDQSE